MSAPSAAQMIIASGAKALSCSRKPYAVQTDNGQSVPARTVIVATGAAYRKLAKRYHPDRRPDDEAAAVQMAEINMAYAILRDSQADMHARQQTAAKPVARKRSPGTREGACSGGR